MEGMAAEGHVSTLGTKSQGDFGFPPGSPSGEIFSPGRLGRRTEWRECKFGEGILARLWQIPPFESSSLVPIETLEAIQKRLSRRSNWSRTCTLSDDVKCWGLEVHFSASVGWVVDIHHGLYLQSGFLATFDSKLRRRNAIQALLSGWMELDISDELFQSYLRMKCALAVNASPPEEDSIPSYAVVVSAVVLLAFVYQYLAGNIDRGGSKAYSRSSLDFRDIYVAIVLFLGAYVWIKFREAAFKGVYPRKLKDKEGRIIKVVYEPRFKPPRENGIKFERIYLGQYDTPEEALILYQIAAFYYNKGEGSLLDLEDGRRFSIPPMREGERSLTGREKRKRVKVQVMKVYKEYKKKKEEAAKQRQEFSNVWDGDVPQEQDEGVAVSNGHSLGPQEGSAIPVSHLAPNAQSGMGNLLDVFQTLVRTEKELNTHLQQTKNYKKEIFELVCQQLQQDINEGGPK